MKIETTITFPHGAVVALDENGLYIVDYGYDGEYDPVEVLPWDELKQILVIAKERGFL